MVLGSHLVHLLDWYGMAVWLHAVHVRDVCTNPVSPLMSQGQLKAVYPLYCQCSHKCDLYAISTLCLQTLTRNETGLMVPGTHFGPGLKFFTITFQFSWKDLCLP